MLLSDVAQILIFVVLLIGLTPLFGEHIAAVFSDGRNILRPVLGWLERLIYWLGGINPKEEMSWGGYARALLGFNLLGLLVLLILQMVQGGLPFNPAKLKGLPFGLAFNTAASFCTNTNWQAYAGETTMSLGTQMWGLTVQNFLSAATGGAAALGLIRGIHRTLTNSLGNFYVDLTRGVVYLLLPLALILALILSGLGVPQTLVARIEAETLEGDAQTIPLGPVASQVAIKQLGTNGGGFYNANSSHPFENPSGWTNILELLAITLLPASFAYAYGAMTRSRAQGWMLFSVMFALWACGFVVALLSELAGDPMIGASPLLEGKEVRLGLVGSVLWSTATTSTANGSVNAMLSSTTPLCSGVALFNIMLGELIFGGFGVGLASMLMFVLLTVFLSGLMVGRTPEYRGKKIEKREVQWVILAILGPSLLILVGSGISSVLRVALQSLSSEGPHGLTEILYAFSSSVGNNGSAFAGLNADTPYYNYVLGLFMLLGRLTILLPTLAVGGLLARKKALPLTAGTFSTETPLFATLLFFSILVVGALTFFPSLSLGPIVEQLLMRQGRSF